MDSRDRGGRKEPVGVLETGSLLGLGVAAPVCGAVMYGVAGWWAVPMAVLLLGVVLALLRWSR